jgi:hypothetical protein
LIERQRHALRAAGAEHPRACELPQLAHRDGEHGVGERNENPDHRSAEDQEFDDVIEGEGIHGAVI